MSKLTLKDINLSGKKVIMRVDFNVPMKDQQITDDTRIKSSLESIRYLLAKNASIILMSHLGRPKGKKDPSFSLTPIAKRLSTLLKTDVIMAKDCIGEKVDTLKKELKPTQILLLENLRFYEEETKPFKDPSFAKKLSSYADIYVNDAFATCHRKHSSTYEIANFFPKTACLGFLIEREITALDPLIHQTPHPFFAIIGGAKISTKIGALESILKRVDKLFIGGAMAFTFFKALGHDIGNSLYEKDFLEKAKDLLHKNKIYLPKDVIIADEMTETANTKSINITEGIPDGWMGLDIGESTVIKWEKELRKSKIVFWNGPLGAFEIKKFNNGTKKIAIALSKLNSAITIIGGGDSVASIKANNLDDKMFSHLSTGGGASLEYIEHGSLPCIDILTDK